MAVTSALEGGDPELLHAMEMRKVAREAFQDIDGSSCVRRATLRDLGQSDSLFPVRWCFSSGEKETPRPSELRGFIVVGMALELW